MSLQNPPHNFKSQINFSFICGHEDKHLIDIGISFHSGEIIMKKIKILILMIFGRINSGLIHNRFQFTAAVMATLIGNDSRSSGYKTNEGVKRRDALLNATKEMIALDDISEISLC